MHDRPGWSSRLQDTATPASFSMIPSTAASSSPSSLAFKIATVAITSLISSTPTLAMASPVTALSTTSLGPPDDGESKGECKLLGPFAVLIQSALGALALLSLVYKRWRERPQRPVKIWAFDASKQVFGSVLLHLANLFMAMFSAGQLEQSLARAAAKAAASASGVEAEDLHQPNPCSFYLLNLAIDTTIGIPILILILKVLSAGASHTPLANPPESIKSGHYGDPPRATWWLKQSIIYFVGLLGMKICVFLVFQLCPWIVDVGDWALRWTEGNEAIQIAFVMLIFPLIMNALQYYIIDTFIKKPLPKEKEEEEEEEERQRDAGNGEHGGLLEGESVERGDPLEEDEAVDATANDSGKSDFESRRMVSYDPDKDGELITEASGSGGSSSLGANAAEEGLKDRPRI